MQRQLSVISGSEQAVVIQQAQNLFKATPQALWITQHVVVTDDAALCIPATKARTVLGREFYLVVFDAWSGLDVNALAAVVGTIRAGGTLVLLTPLLQNWHELPDPDYRRFLPYPWLPEQMQGCFLRRLVRVLETHSLINAEDISVTPPMFKTKTTIDQLTALKTILRAECPIVLNADRGRGKSAILGMAAREFENAGKRVVLTAPSRATVETVFRHADNKIEFYAPDDLLQLLPDADVLLVDEAAAIPVPMLIRMQQAYPRCVFSTTLRGYEGSGRGFVLRFQRVLDELAPDWLDVKLHSPIRWGEGDELEAFVNRWLIMDGSDKDKPFPGLPLLRECRKSRASALRFISYPQSELVTNEPKLREIFNLLINAHYQTRPSDLRQLLDAPQISIHVIENEGQVVAVALLSAEGGLEENLVAEIHTGKRRPHGHLLAQSLTFHAGIEKAACLRCERIMRIAVHPDCRYQGIGHHLLARLNEYARQQRADYLGVSYALSPGLLTFWRKAGFASVRLGFRKDAASGSRSLMQVLGLSDEGIMLSQHARQIFQAGLPEFLKKLDDVPDTLANELLTEQV